MEEWVESWTGYVIDAWRSATPLQFLQVLLPVALLGWYLCRFRRD
jgi:hypothetical protein